jgi:zinc transporter ZupT
MRGIIVSAGIILCQYPESIEYFKGLKQSWSLRRVVIASFLSPYVMLIGAAIGLFLLKTSYADSHFSVPLSGITIGLFLYKGISNVVTREDGHYVRIAGTIAGCALVVAASRFFL